MTGFEKEPNSDSSRSNDLGKIREDRFWSVSQGDDFRK
jgi:hypothetical protein